MGWIKVEKSVKPAAPEGAKLALRVGVTRSSLTVTLPNAQCGVHGWDHAETADAFFGEGEHAGRLMLQAVPAKLQPQGLLQIKRWKSAVIITVPGQEGWPQESMKFKSVPLAWDENAAVITLPDVFMQPPPVRDDVSIPQVAAVNAAKGKAGDVRPRDLSITGNVVTLGTKSVRLNSMHFKAFSLLDRSWGRAVHAQTVIDALELKSDEILTFFRIFRDKLAPLGLIIIQVPGEGYLMKRSPEA